jgi:penicillin-binding protein 1B
MSKARKKTAVRRKKKTTARRKKKNQPVRKSWLGRVWRFFALLAGIFLGLMIPWIVYLNYQVTTEFEGRKWDLPSRVYARALELYPGLGLSLRDMETELQASGYQRSPELTRPGIYDISGKWVEVYRRPFRFQEGAEDFLRFRLRFESGRVTQIRDAVSGKDLGLVRLDPAEIASIYPLHKEDRTLVKIDDVPDLLVTGLQAVEDRSFKRHPGVDLRGISRAALANLRAGKAIQGGSTLTQQLVKNYFLSPDRTVVRKFNEAIMALLLELHYGKAEILEAYLNEIFLGQQGALAIHGFGRASVYYFDQPLERLEPQQIALLIGLVRGASLYNPRKHPQRALERRNKVLGIFADTGLLTAKEADEAGARPLGVTKRPRSGGNRFHAFIDLVRDQLSRDYREEDLKSEGLRIFTTLAPSEQEKAQRSVSTGLERLQAVGLSSSLQAALVLADASSGEVRALVGGRDAGKVGFNRALNARRQIGSIIKPLVYLLALEHGSDYNLLTMIEDEPISLRQPDGSEWTPSNYDDVSHGSVSLLEALTHSYNQATVRVGLNIGANHLIQKLAQLGVEADIDAVPSIFLGAVELTPLEVTQIYQSLAAGGFSVPLRAVTAVLTSDDGELMRYPLRLMPLARREVIAVLSYALTQVVEQGTAKALPGLLGSPPVIAGKTGTTNDRRDSWFVGYTRNRIGVTWVGEDDNRPARVTGSNAAMRLWAGLFRDLPLESVDLRMPDGANWLWVDADSGGLSHEKCPGSTQIPFVEGSEPTVRSECLASMEDDDESFWSKLFGTGN